MESVTVNQEDQPTNSNEEVDQPEQDVGTAAGGRSYECIFCKRGFTTAQALGGHMNIHRKDRAKSRPNTLNNNNYSTKRDEYAGPRLYQPIFASCPPRYVTSHHHQGGQIHYRTYFPSTSSSRPISYGDHNDHSNYQDPNGLNTSLSREEMTMSLSLQFGQSSGEEIDLKKSIQSGSAEDELDLELRLGHDP